MSKFDNTMIVTDVDGTFLGSHSRLVPENLEAVKYFTRNGGLFTFASGRMHMNLLKAVPEPEKLINIPGVMANGSYMYDFAERRVLSPEYLDGKLTSEVLVYVRHNYPDVGIRISASDGFLTDSLTGAIKKDLTSNVITNVTVRPVEKWIEDSDKWYKVVLRDTSENLDIIRADLEHRYPGAFEYCKSGATFFEFQKAGCTKATTVEKLRRQLEAESKTKLRLVCCGDFENDTPMLKTADFAACPDNALDSVKSICQARLCHCDDGFIAELINML